jgi:adenine C2-methylase RlmN of 23S rRNA A2503 and tRNA A37
MGEPLQNYPAVMGAVRGMVDVRRFGLSHDHVTISTVGVVPKIRQMTLDYPNLNLALSLHAPTQELRLQIVPSAKAFPLEKLMAACFDHCTASKKALFVEYVLVRGWVGGWVGRGI